MLRHQQQHAAPDGLPGCLLGLYITANGACGDIAAGLGYDSRGATADPATNTTFSFSPASSDDIRLDISATLEADADGDGLGDETEDADDDGDGVMDASDNCPSAANPGQANADGDAQGDACDGTPRGTPVGPTPDTTKPVLSSLSMSSSVFQAAGSGPAFAAKVGATVSFSVSEASTVRFTVQRKTKGRRVAGSCKRRTQANRTKKACTRWVTVKGSFSIPAEAGATSFTFRGRIGDKKLKPGSYRLNGRATDTADNNSATKRATFRIVK